MLQKVNDKQRIIVPVFFFVLLMIGILFVKDFGMPWDEPLEKTILQSNLKEYAKVLLGRESNSYQRLDKLGVEDISSYIEKDHGEAFYYAYAPIWNLTSNLRWAMLSYHFYIYLIFLLGAFTLYLIIKRLTKDWKYGILGCLLLFLSPRIFAEGFYNNKDTVLLSGILFCIWFGIKFIDTSKYRYSILFALVCAFTANLRIIGFFIFGLIGLLYIITRFMNKEWSVSNFLSGLLAVISFSIIFLIITPATWSNPVEYFKYVFTQSMNFVRWTGYVFYQGNIYNNEVKPLPWNYLLVMFVLTTPILTTVLIFLGHVVAIREAIKAKLKGIFKEESKYYLMLMVFVWLPVTYVLVLKPTIYNGWRHFYFIYGPLLILAVCAVKSLIHIKKKRIRNVIVTLIGIQLCTSLLVMIKNHPNEYVYYNVLAGKNIDHNYELDYWNVSSSECLRKLVDKVYVGEKIKVSAKDYSSNEGLIRGYDILPEKYKSKIKIVDAQINSINVDYWICNPDYNRRDRMIEEYLYHQNEEYDFVKNCDEVVSVRAFGSKLMIIYKLKD